MCIRDSVNVYVRMACVERREVVARRFSGGGGGSGSGSGGRGWFTARFVVSIVFNPTIVWWGMSFIRNVATVTATIAS